jgi:hypothetical protein
MNVKHCCTRLLLILLSAVPAWAQQSAPAVTGGQDLQKAKQDPIAGFISVSLQNNSNFDIGPYDRMQNVPNIQPVIPLKSLSAWHRREFF